MGEARNFARLADDQSKKQKRCHLGSREREERTIHFATLPDICHLKITEPESKFQKYKGRVVLRGDTVQRRLWSLCSLYWTGPICVSKWQAANVMDVIARLPDCDGQAADNISADTQVKMEDAPRLLTIPKSECPDIWIRLPRHKWPKSLSNIEDPVVPLERKLYEHPLAGLLWER